MASTGARLSKDGSKSYLHTHAVSISKFSVRTELPSGRFCVASQPYLFAIAYFCLYYADNSEPAEPAAPMVALEHLDRVCSIRMCNGVFVGRIGHRLAEAILAAGKSHSSVVIYRLFSAPFPTFPGFLRSAKDLAKLQLVDIPPIGSISWLLVWPCRLNLDTSTFYFHSKTRPNARFRPIKDLLIP